MCHDKILSLKYRTSIVCWQMGNWKKHCDGNGDYFNYFEKFIYGQERIFEVQACQNVRFVV